MKSKINYRSLDELVYKKIKDMILNNQLEPGTKIIQSELADKLGVSRTPIRRALSQLAKEHLVRVTSRGGAYVKSFSREEMITVFEIREVLEGLACRRAARVVKEEQLDYYRKLYQKAMRSINDDDWRAYEKADIKFHFFIIEASGVELLEDIVKSFHILSNSFTPGLIRPPQETFPEHMAVIDALARHDPDAAENLMREHLKRTIAVLKKSPSEKL